MSVILREQRCVKCGKLLLKGMLFSGHLEIKCLRCKTDNIIQGIGGAIHDRDRYDILFDFEGHIVDVSDSATDILGYSREEFLGMRREDLRSDISPADYQDLRAVLMTGVGPVAFDTVHRKKDGKFLPVKLQIRVLVSEGSRFALVMGRVIEHPARENGAAAKRYEFSVNTLGQFIYVSNPLAHIFGRRWITLIGKPINDYFVCADADSTFLSARLSEGEFFQVDGICIQPTKGTVDPCFKIHFYPQKDDSGVLVGYNAVALSADSP